MCGGRKRKRVEKHRYQVTWKKSIIILDVCMCVDGWMCREMSKISQHIFVLFFVNECRPHIMSPKKKFSKEVYRHCQKERDAALHAQLQFSTKQLEWILGGVRGRSCYGCIAISLPGVMKMFIIYSSSFTSHSNWIVLSSNNNNNNFLSVFASRPFLCVSFDLSI